MRRDRERIATLALLHARNTERVENWVRTCDEQTSWRAMGASQSIMATPGLGVDKIPDRMLVSF
jgi:hypothetical protein